MFSITKSIKIQNPRTLVHQQLYSSPTMSFSSHNFLTNTQISFYCANTHLRNPSFSQSLPSKHSVDSLHLRIEEKRISYGCNFASFRTRHWPVRAYESPGTVPKQGNADDFSLDAFLSVAEFLCLASSAAISIGLAVNSFFGGSQKPVLWWLGNRVLAWQLVLLVGGLVIGVVIRQRQWRRIYVDLSRSGGSAINLVERIEKLEEDLRNSTTVTRVLSRQLEKLGIRFRVTRRSLKDPIAETAALAQKNSEATRALAVQEDILEQEISEIQKVLLAMQEQQQKQLELIITIAKSGKLWESKPEEKETIQPFDSAGDGVPHSETNQVEAFAGQKEVDKDKA